MKYDYLIIGNSIAAVGCIEGIRENDTEGSICVVTDENYRVYGRPLISYYLWNKTTEKKMLSYRPDNFYKKNDVELMLGTRAEKINPEKKTAANNNIFTWCNIKAANVTITATTPRNVTSIPSSFTE